MTASVFLEHAFAEAEQELNGFVEALTGWRNAPQLWVDYDRSRTDRDRPWLVKDGADCDRVRGHFRWLAAATTYAESLAASMPGATFKPFEPML